MGFHWQTFARWSMGKGVGLRPTAHLVSGLVASPLPQGCYTCI